MFCQPRFTRQLSRRMVFPMPRLSDAQGMVPRHRAAGMEEIKSMSKGPRREGRLFPIKIEFRVVRNAFHELTARKRKVRREKPCGLRRSNYFLGVGIRSVNNNAVLVEM